MALADLDVWTASQSVTAGDKVADGETVYSAKNAQHLADLLNEIIAALDSIKADLAA